MSQYLNSHREADWYACPSCGDEVRVGSDGCRKCRGKKFEDFEDGMEGDWTGGGDLPDDPEDFDYEDWKKREFGVKAKIKPHHLPLKYWITGILLVVAMIWGLVFAGFIGR